MSSIEDAVCKKIQSRATFGLLKYKVSLADANYSRLQGLIHAQEEAMDLCAYLEKEIQREEVLQAGITSYAQENSLDKVLAEGAVSSACIAPAPGCKVCGCTMVYNNISKNYQLAEGVILMGYECPTCIE